MRLPRVHAALLTAASLVLSAIPAGAAALHNPIVATIRPQGPHGAHGRATFFQLGSAIDASVILRRDHPGTQRVGIYRGTCSRHAARPDWVLVGVAGTTQSTRLPHVRLQQLLGHALVVHAGASGSATIGCAPIRNVG